VSRSVASAWMPSRSPSVRSCYRCAWLKPPVEPQPALQEAAKKRMRRTAIVLALTSLQVLASLPASPAETWAWFRTVSTGTEWWITEGKGDVNFSGSRFKATLRDAENPELTRLSLQGSVTRGLVKARVTVSSLMRRCSKSPVG